MKKSDDLFQLIKAMSKSEKRYFRLHAGVHTIGEENVYMKLFDVIDNMDTYDEDLIVKKFKGEKFVKNLFSAKKYLFDLILKILVSFKQEGNLDLKLLSMLSELDIIQDKGLYKLYKSRLQKVEKIAAENEKYYTQAFILERKAVYRLTQFYEGKTEWDMDVLRSEMFEALDKIKYTYEYKMLYDELFFLLREDNNRIEGGESEILRKFISNPLFKDESKAITPLARYFYGTMLAHYYFWSNDFERSYKYRKDLIEFFENTPRYMELYPKSFLSAVANMGAACERIQRYEEMKTYSDKVKMYLNKWYSNTKANSDTWSKIITVLCDMDVTYIVKTCRFDAYVEIKKILDDQDKYSDKYNEPRKIIVYNAAACFYFANGDFPEALSYINKVLNAKNAYLEERIFIIAKIISLFIHYEMGNFDLLEYTIKSTKNYLIKLNGLQDFERLLIDFFIDAINNNNDKELRQRLEKLGEKLKKENKYDQFLDSFDVISWVESKISKRDLKEVLKEKRELQLEKGIGD